MNFGEALQKIEQFSDVGNDFLAVCMMKSIATDALKEQISEIDYKSILQEQLDLLKSLKFQGGDEQFFLVDHYRNKLENILSQEDKPTEEVKPSPYVESMIPMSEKLPHSVEEKAEKWVFESNGKKWSNNDNSAGDNFGSFIAGHQSGYNQAIEEIEEWVNTCPVNIMNVKSLLNKLNSLKTKQ